MIDCFLLLGGNVGDVCATLRKTILSIAALKGVYAPKTSRPFSTFPVSPFPQPSFVNVGVHLKTSLTPHALFASLEEIEKKMGKKEKLKSEPRPIDIDLIFYGTVEREEEGLILPHPRWKERLFVLYPLADLVGLTLPSCKEAVPLNVQLPFQVLS